MFEMEDQRNWSDASYKTYSRPLSLPFPYPIAAGERVRQSVWIGVKEAAPAVEPSDADLVRLEVGGPVPEIVLGAATGAGSCTRRNRPGVRGRARRTRPAHAELAGRVEPRRTGGLPARRPSDRAGRRGIR